jgi:hypothetical protein
LFLPTLAVEFHYPASLHVIQNLKSNGELGSNSLEVENWATPLPCFSPCCQKLISNGELGSNTYTLIGKYLKIISYHLDRFYKMKKGHLSVVFESKTAMNNNQQLSTTSKKYKNKQQQTQQSSRWRVVVISFTLLLETLFAFASLGLI